MNNKKIIVLMSAALFFAMITNSLAQEQEGFIKRLFRRRAETPKTAAVPAAEKGEWGAVSAGIEKTTAPEQDAVPGAVIPDAAISAAAVPSTEEEMVDKKPFKEMTKEDLIEYITDMLDYEDDLSAAIPELKKEEEGFYTYNGIKLEDLDREKLDALFSRIQNEINRIRTERLSQQLESIKQALQANVNARQVNQAHQNYVAVQRSIEDNIVIQRAAKMRATSSIPPNPQAPPNPPHIQPVQQQYQPPPTPPQVPRQPPQPPAPPRR